MGRLSFERAMEKKRAQKRAEAAGEVADSQSVRLEIMARIKSGEMTLAQGQAELKKIQDNAKRIGLKTRLQAFKEA
jgi:hypothetical protein